LHDTKINVCVFVFDIIFLNGEPMIEAPLQQRLSTMENSAIKFEDRRIESAKRVHLDAGAASEQIIRNSLQRAWDGRCEGLMLKSLSSKYEPDSRSDHWLKLKRDYCEDIQDSLDLVPIGAWFGNGRKAGWYSPILLAAWNPEAEAWESVCRCLSGFTDEFYKALKAKYSSEKDSLLPSKPHYYSTGESPSVWFKPTEVWEIRGADYTISPVHHAGAGLVDAQKGISVRFPRFVRCRPDKQVEEATTNEQLADMYLQQNRKR
jgi:DNA ligase-1